MITGRWIFFLCFFFLSCQIHVNQTIYIQDGKEVTGDTMTVNGNIIIGSNCKIHGSCRTVNGFIEMGRDSKVRDVQSVNGSIRLAKDVYVKGSLESVNGTISCDAGDKVRGRVATINGSIELHKARVRRNVQTYNGHVSLLDSTTVYGDVIVKRGHGSFSRQKPLKIEIRNGSVVKGNVVADEEDENVELHLSGGGKVLGETKHLKVIEE